MAPLCSGSRCTPGAVLGGRAGSGSSLILCLMFQAGRTRQEMRIKESRRSVETLRDLPTPVRVRLWQGQGCPGAFLGLQRPALLLWPGQVSAEMVQPPCASVSPVKGLCLCAVSCLAMNWVRGAPWDVFGTGKWEGTVVHHLLWVWQVKAEQFSCRCPR